MVEDRKIYDRKLQAPSSSFFLFGMRGVGKTTWARARFGNAQAARWRIRQGRERFPAA